MSARAEIWRVDQEGGVVVSTDDKGNEYDVAYVDDPDHARWIARVPQLIEIIRKLNKQVYTVLASDGRKGVRVPEAYGVEGVTELLAEIDGKWPGEVDGA